MEISGVAASVGLPDQVVVRYPAAISCRLPLPPLGCMSHYRRKWQYLQTEDNQTDILGIYNYSKIRIQNLLEICYTQDR